MSSNQNPIIRSQQGEAYIYQVEEKNNTISSLIALIPIRYEEDSRLLLHEEVFPKHVEELIHEFITNPLQLKPLIVMHQSSHLKQTVLESLRDASIVNEIGPEQERLHRLLAIDNSLAISRISQQLNLVDRMCIADGHHRFSALSSYYADKGRKSLGRSPFILAALVYADDLSTKDCLISIQNKNIKENALISLLENDFQISLSDAKAPDSPFTYCLYFQSRWFILEANENNQKKIADKGWLPIEFFRESVLKKVFQIFNYANHSDVSVSYHKNPIQMLISSPNAHNISFILKRDTPSCIFNFSLAHRLLEANSTCFEPKLVENLIFQNLATSTIEPMQSTIFNKELAYDY